MRAAMSLVVRRRWSGKDPDRSLRLPSSASLKDLKAGTDTFFKFC